MLNKNGCRSIYPVEGTHYFPTRIDALDGFLKGGGIWEKDAQDIVNNYTYETLTNASNYSHTVAKAFRATEEGNYLKRYQETRIFSEGNYNEE